MLRPKLLRISARWRSLKAKKQSIKDKQRNFVLEQTKKLKRMKGLHPAAKWKRVLSACDYWFSKGNLVDDAYLIQELRKNDGKPLRNACNR